MPAITVAVGGTFAKLTGGGGPRSGGGPRGKVNGFSRESRKRLMDLLNQVEQTSLDTGLFVTLTYPDRFPRDAKRWKRDLDAFMKRARRRYPRAVSIWRMEFATRRSGSNAGEVAPHYHVIMLGVPRLSLEWLGRSWYEIVGSGDEKHLFAGTSAQRIRSKNGIKYYASKYMSKEAINPECWTGRVWGVYGRDLLPIVLVAFELTWRQFYKLRRVLRSWLSKRVGKGRYKHLAKLRGQGITAYLDDGTSGRLLAWACGVV